MVRHDPCNFLGLPDDHCSFERAGVLVLPIPLEATVSYGGGTARGPAAIMAASQQVELYDRDSTASRRWSLACIPCRRSSCPTSRGGGRGDRAPWPAAARTGKLVVGLGGEHTVSVGFGRGLLAALGGPLTVVQIDAHSDLRDEYEGTPYSHACIARRLLESRGSSRCCNWASARCARRRWPLPAEPGARRVWYAEDVHDGDWRSDFVPACRSPGLPDHRRGRAGPRGRPGHGHAGAGRADLERDAGHPAQVAQHADCRAGLRGAGAGAGLHAADFAVAKLVYKAITYAMRRRA